MSRRLLRLARQACSAEHLTSNCSQLLLHVQCSEGACSSARTGYVFFGTLVHYAILFYVVIQMRSYNGFFWSNWSYPKVLSKHHELDPHCLGSTPALSSLLRSSSSPIYVSPTGILCMNVILHLQVIGASLSEPHVSELKSCYVVRWSSLKNFLQFFW